MSIARPIASYHALPCIAKLDPSARFRGSIRPTGYMNHVDQVLCRQRLSCQKRSPLLSSRLQIPLRTGSDNVLTASTMLDQVTIFAVSHHSSISFQLRFSLLDIVDSIETEKNYIYATVQPKSSTEVTRSPPYFHL